jgi:hypothetical protein
MAAPAVLPQAISQCVEHGASGGRLWAAQGSRRGLSRRSRNLVRHAGYRGRPHAPKYSRTGEDTSQNVGPSWLVAGGQACSRPESSAGARHLPGPDFTGRTLSTSGRALYEWPTIRSVVQINTTAFVEFYRLRLALLSSHRANCRDNQRPRCMLRINQTSPPNSAIRMIGVAAMDHTHSSRGSSATPARTARGRASQRLEPMSFSRCTAAKRKTTANGTPTTRVASSVDLPESENKPPTHRSPWYAARPAAPHNISKR